MKTVFLRSVIAVFAFLSLGVLAIPPRFPVSGRGNAKASPISLRLPNDTRPVSYDIHLETRVDLGDLNFSGRVKIIVEVLNETNEIVLHARRIEIKSVNLLTAYYVTEDVAVTFTYDNATDFLTIRSTENPLAPMYYYLTIEYAGELRTDNAGFYLSTYRDENNNLIDIATTQFESTDARHAFPCYDEPAKKAVFKLSIKHGSSYSAISNMPVIQGPNDNGDGTSTTSFQQSTLMSTYLLAFIVSNFDYTELKSRIPHRVYSRLETMGEHNFPLTSSVLTLEAFENYLNVKYKLPKLDNVAIPDFSSGAMENWGIITYREETLLFNDLRSTSLTQGNIIEVMNHELAHQWFGNLISPYWWTFLWLNEGFATLLTFIGAEAVYPSWDLWQRFHVEMYDTAMEADGKGSPRPLTHYVESPSEIDSVFDEISYVKGASFLNMIRHSLSDDLFRKAVYYYLQEMEFSAAEEDDLFRNFQKAVDEFNIKMDVFKLFKSWTNQGGFPLITVTRNYEKGTFFIKQSPFGGTNQTPSTDNRSWWVPFNFATAQNSNYGDTTMYDFLNVGEESKEIKPNEVETWSNEDWIILNKKSTSYYRINYDMENWKLLTEALISNPGQFHVLNRAQLLDDAYAFVLSKHMKITAFLDLSVYLKKETEYAPWAKANAILNKLNQYLSGDSRYDLFQYYIGKIVERFYSKVSVTEASSDDHLTKVARGFATNWACQANYGDCLKITGEKLYDFVHNGKSVQPNMMTSIFCYGLKNAGETEYEYLLKQLLDSKDAAFRLSLINNVMGCTQNATLLNRYLGSSTRFDDSITYKLEERTNVLPGVAAMGPTQFDTVVDFLISNHAAYSKIPSLYRVTPLVSALRSIAGKVVTQQQNVKFEELLSTLNSYKDIEDAKESLRTTVKANLAWVSQYRGELVEWLSNFKKKGEGDGNGECGDGATAIVGSTAAMLSLIVVSLSPLY